MIGVEAGRTIITKLSFHDVLVGKGVVYPSDSREISKLVKVIKSASHTTSLPFLNATQKIVDSESQIALREEVISGPPLRFPADQRFHVVYIAEGALIVENKLTQHLLLSIHRPVDPARGTRVVEFGNITFCVLVIGVLIVLPPI